MGPLRAVVDFYNWCNSFADPRNNGWLLMSSPLPTIVILVTYLVIVKKGPRYMDQRPAMKARWPLVVYNSGITALNGWMAYELVHCAMVRKYNYICQLVDTSDNEHEVRIAKAIWWYYFSKLLEFMDTFFFILRKKPKQLTFLHVYHHSTMFLFWWVGARFVPGGSALSGAVVNCFVHVIMYGYYALAALGPKVQRYLWWKKYLTILQLVQFTMGVVLGLNAILSGCQFTRWMQYVFVGYAFSFIVLFSKFYKKEYGHPGIQDGAKEGQPCVAAIAPTKVKKILARKGRNKASKFD
ncbi:Elongation of very long chain fatty acids protein 4 [Halotydeus destructor]|nr:Elongation of very long chain fatty acids protein 4 [Halotydeus destructor]